MEGSVLVVEDDETLLKLATAELHGRGFKVVGAPTAEAALALAAMRRFDVVLTDLQMPGMSGLELCARLRERAPGTPVLVMTVLASVDTAVSAMRAGAYDFIAKPLSFELVAVRLGHVIEEQRAHEEVERLRREVDASQRFEELEGQSAAMRQLFHLLARLAATDATVLLIGESGTGKEVTARAIHRRSARHKKPFVGVNCATLPEPLLESELFGHVRGAFTDAKSDREGLFVQANGGTLLLDEIGDLPLGLQPKLLRVLEERRVRPLGASAERPIDVRVIAATHRDLARAVTQGSFRQDLFYRLDVVRVAIPPLRQRDNDVLLLAQRLIDRLVHPAPAGSVKLSPEAARALLSHDWPGNVRELRNAMERALALGAGAKLIDVDVLPDVLRPGGARKDPAAPALAPHGDDLELSLEAVEKRHIAQVLAAHKGNKRAAARILGLDRKTLYRKLERFGLGSASDE